MRRKSGQGKLTEKNKLSRFIAHISDKNYAAANKYLESVVEDKIKQRIGKCLDKPLF